MRSDGVHAKMRDMILEHDGLIGLEQTKQVVSTTDKWQAPCIYCAAVTGKTITGIKCELFDLAKPDKKIFIQKPQHVLKTKMKHLVSGQTGRPVTPAYKGQVSQAMQLSLRSCHSSCNTRYHEQGLHAKSIEAIGKRARSKGCQTSRRTVIQRPMHLSHHKMCLVQEVILHQRWPKRLQHWVVHGVLYSVSTVRSVSLDTENGTDGVRTMLDDCGVPVVRVDKSHRVAIERVMEGMPSCNRTSMTDSRGESFELVGGKTGGEGQTIVSSIVDRTPMLPATYQGLS